MSSDKALNGGEVVVEEAGTGRFVQDISAHGYSWSADEPESSGGNGTAPDPYDLLLSALGACTSMTLRLYAERKGWDLRSVKVTLHHDRVYAADCETCDSNTGQLSRIVREISVEGDLNDEQRKSLLAIADRCPVHKTLQSEVVIETDVF